MDLAEERGGNPPHHTLSAFARKPDAALRLTQEALADPAVPPFIAGQETTPT
ncbi:hypothetical protein ACWDA7_33275 [Streptomyces sp. NPDC001156]